MVVNGATGGMGALGRAAVSVAVGTAVGSGVGLWQGWIWGLLGGLALGGVLFAALAWAELWPRDAAATQARAQRDEFRPGLEELVVASMVAVAVAATFVTGVLGAGGQQRWAGLLALVAVLSQWFGLHAMYAARYAYEYYDGAEGGIDFNDDEAPCYRDFLYFSYNLGMTYQVSDTAVRSGRIRAVVLRHCLISFLFSLTILATAINVVASVVLGH